MKHLWTAQWTRKALPGHTLYGYFPVCRKRCPVSGVQIDPASCNCLSIQEVHIFMTLISVRSAIRKRRRQGSSEGDQGCDSDTGVVWQRAVVIWLVSGCLLSRLLWMMMEMLCKDHLQLFHPNLCPKRILLRASYRRPSYCCSCTDSLRALKSSATETRLMLPVWFSTKL